MTVGLQSHDSISRPSRAGRAGRTGRAGRAGRTGRTGRAGRAGRGLTVCHTCTHTITRATDTVYRGERPHLRDPLSPCRQSSRREYRSVLPYQRRLASFRLSDRVEPHPTSSRWSCFVDPMQPEMVIRSRIEVLYLEFVVNRRLFNQTSHEDTSSI